MSEIFDFIHRRFPTDCRWLDGNCYYFAVILKARFPEGNIFYDVTYGHFVFGHDGRYYDWTGEIEPQGYLVDWELFEAYDALVYQRVLRDCVY